MYTKIKFIIISQLLFLVLSFKAYSQEENTKIDSLFKNIESLSWDIPIDSAVQQLSFYDFDSCYIVDRDNHFTVGPCVVCNSDSIIVSIAYQWSKTDSQSFFPALSFYSIKYKDCSKCLQFYNCLGTYGFVKPSKYDPVELERVEKNINSSNGNKTKIEVWNECCPGNRLKIYETVTDSQAR